jgi:hypothetical protein
VGFTDTPAVRAVLNSLAASPNSTARSTGLAGLLQMKDKQALLTFLASRKAFSPIEENRIVGRISSPAFRSTDPEIIQALGIAMNDPSSSPGLQQAAAQFLRAVHTRETLPHLAILLDSPIPDRQVDAVFGFSGFANGFEIVSHLNTTSMTWLTNRKDTPYTTDQTLHYLLLGMGADAGSRQEVVTFWRNWWKDHAAALATSN